ncbi:hypothetical protein D0869_07379 [Hortaea werneckii]|uniref:Vanadium chloroperoxidase N-terminal domain-containing protein n=1 Tax=Hortaea werneckii TaxID=91943 RepID=A0A3M6WQF7_HORWE|nr:hypothetical protein D0869_07379 [Hortaea werneckii]RMY14887.1 hypothetical protein D0868_01189 [Hortaea werneckii]
MIRLHQRLEEAEYNKNYVLYWNHVALELVRLTHTETASGAVNGPPLVARMSPTSLLSSNRLGILHPAIHDAFFALHNTAGMALTLAQHKAIGEIGVPLRLYNQILRKVAWNYRPDKKIPDSDKNNVEFARLFTLCNAAMADAGIFAWQEKYCFEFWQPLSGVRKASRDLIVRNRGNGMVEGIPDPDRSPTMGDATDPFWLELGAPSTNSNRTPFKPAFPAYPSGHAAFGAACFQMMRLYYKNSHREGIADFDVDGPDNIAFDFVSDEQDGQNRDNLRHAFDPTVPIDDQPGIVHAAWKRRFSSLWEAMWENAVSRVWLGVHWRFDAFSSQDTLVPNETPSPATTKTSSPSSTESPPLYAVGPDQSTSYKPVAEVRCTSTGSRRDRPGKDFLVGGVPLGIDIANDIFQGGLKPTPPNRQPTGRHRRGRL